METREPQRGGGAAAGGGRSRDLRALPPLFEVIRYTRARVNAVAYGVDALGRAALALFIRPRLRRGRDRESSSSAED